MEQKYDFCGWATKNNLRCSDGRTIMQDAFKDNDGATVPLVWMHQHNEAKNVLGHAVLENRPEGVFTYGYLNDSPAGQNAKLLIEHGDIIGMSIYANGLKENCGNVLHGQIREVSLVLAGANPGAFITEVIRHSDDGAELPPNYEEGILYSGESISLFHAEEEKTEPIKEEKKVAEPEEKKQGNEKTVGDVLDTLNEEQKKVVFGLLGEAIEKSAEADNKESKGGEDDMKHNVFDQEEVAKGTVLSHSEMEAIFSDAKRIGSLKEAFRQHEVDESSLAHTVTDDSGNTVSYGIANIDYLFPDARNINDTPDFISRKMDWVQKVIGGAKHLPFSRVKSLHANITMDEARAKGYIKGNLKAEEVFALLKRSTSPCTIYKKQKLDRDDLIDIVDIDVVAWLKREMRMMLDEEIARAVLIGDGRTAGTDDKISEDCIRPIWKDSDVYVVRKAVTSADGATADDKAKATIRTIVKSRKDYKGSGNLTMFTTEDFLTDALLLEDGNGRVIYDTMEKLKTALRVDSIVTVEVMENQTREGSGADAGYDFNLVAILVNMSDYAIGADKGGAVNMFDDFDIDYNQQKYLIETRCSGALVKPYSAIVIEEKVVSA